MLRLLQSNIKQQQSLFRGLLLAVLSLFLSVTIAGCGGSGGGASAPNVTLTINPEAPITPMGVTCYVNAIARFSNGVSKNVTDDVTWSSADKNIATIDGTGKVTPLKVGTVEIYASYGKINTVVPLTVTDAVLQSVKIKSETGSFITPNKVKLDLIAIGTFTDGSALDVTKDVVWSSSNTAVATVEEGVVSPLMAGKTNISIALAGSNVKAEELVTVTDPEVKSVTIGSQTGTYDSPVGEPLKLTAQANYSDGTSVDITNKDVVTWQSDSTSIATVDKGVVLPLAQGTSNITATFEGVTGSRTITVTAGSLESLKIEGDDTTPFQIPVKLKVLGVFTDGSTQEITEGLTWVAEGDATVLDGEVTPTAVGEATITVSYKGLEAKHKITITGCVLESLTIGSQTDSFETPVGVPLTLTVQANFSDGTSKDITGEDAISWESSSTAYATVYNGIVDPISLGKADITATFEGISATQQIEVKDSELESLTIEGKDSTPALMPITLKVMGTYSDGSTQEVTDGLSWSASGDATVLDGEVTPTSVGKATITVTKGKLKAQHQITITDAIVKSLTIGSETGSFETPVGVPLNLTVQANFSDGTSMDITGEDAITWKSSSVSYATVSNGIIDPLKVGKAEITATFEGVSATEEIVVSDAILQSLAIEGEDSTPLSLPITLKAMGTYTDGSTREVTDGLTWSASGDATVLDGEVTPTAIGKATITVTKDELKAEHEVAITDAVVTSLTIGSETGSFESPIGVPLTLTVQANFSDGTSKDVTGQDAISWKSASTSFATVSNGIVNPIKNGKAEITATFEGVSASQEITIIDAVLQSLAIEGDTSTPALLPITLKVMGTYTDGSTREVTDGLNWSASGEATVVDGEVTPTASGEATITVTKDELSAEHKVTITDAVVTSLTIGSETGSFESPIGVPLNLTVQANFSDGTNKDITGQDAISWKSASTSYATVSGGTVNPIKKGKAEITATFEGVSAPQEITIIDAVLQSLAIEGDDTTPLSLPVTLKAIGTYSDGSTQEVTDGLTWSVAEGEATVVDGVVTPTVAGNVKISVSKDGVDEPAEHEITVTNAVITKIELSLESDDPISIGSQRQLIAKATLSDDSVIDNIAKRDAVNWSSDSTSVATVAAGKVTFSRNAEVGDTVGITASVDVNGTPVSGSISLTIAQEGALESIELVSASGNFSVPCGGTDTIKVTCNYADGRVVEDADPAMFTWTISGDTYEPGEGSEPTSIISITDGVLTALHAGEANIAVAYTEDDSIKTSHSYTVTEAPLVSIEIEGAGEISMDMPSMILQAKGTFADGTESYVTLTSEWKSSDEGVATVNAGIVRPVAVGDTYITCKNGDIEESVLIHVARGLESIEIVNPPTTMVVGQTKQLNVIGHFTDGTTGPINTSIYTISWEVRSNDAAIATVSDDGMIEALAAGTGLVQCIVRLGDSGDPEAAISLCTDSFNLTVEALTLTSITLDCEGSTTIHQGDTVQLTATGHYNDGSTSDLTNEVDWDVSDEYGLILSIENGLVTTDGTLAVPVGATAQIGCHKDDIPTSTPVTLTVADT